MIKKYRDSLVNIIYPRRCLVCHRHLKSNNLDNVVCLDCWSMIKKNVPPFCNRCGRSLGRNHIQKRICPQCQKTAYRFDRALSPCAYEGVLKELIAQFKYKGKDYLGKTLSRLLIDFITEYNLEIKLFDLLAPVPLHNRKLREREFNQAEVLGGFIASRFGIPLAKDELLRIRDTSTQTGLTDQKRRENLKNSFAVKKRNNLRGKNILLVDDVLTTAATACEAAGALKQAGAGVVFVLTLAN